MDTARHNLRQAADSLLDPGLAPGDLIAAAHSLREALGVLAEWQDTGPEATREISLAAGVAISPIDAARCILEFQRTACFLRGTLRAITAAQAETDSPVDVLYAGCGPLAPLAVALCHRLQDVTFWPIDIHPGNVASVRRLIANAGYGASFGAVEQADACGHQWPRPGHVAVAEVMQRGLEKEPQITVTANLARQLLPAGRMVPASVRLDMQLFEPRTEFELSNEPAQPRVRHHVAPLLDLRADTAAALAGGCTREIELTNPDNHAVLITTGITVQDEIALGDYDCSLTIPWIARDLGRPTTGQTAIVSLSSGTTPRLAARLR